ncbi:hypothetical protein VTK73DRAFT_4785 [Phialemonium thermophilum]|uniref:Uncharacterized protein n=1 Tax=Phialemonium thermophilum TaxID=223376 RepID=A0ABR3XYL5_9PEZI
MEQSKSVLILPLLFLARLEEGRMQPRSRPIQKFAAAVSRCSAEAVVYGKCIVADYNSVHKDKCLKEFLKLKDCYLAATKNNR